MQSDICCVYRELSADKLHTGRKAVSLKQHTPLSYTAEAVTSLANKTRSKHAHAIGSQAAGINSQDGSFIKTVPMQHVQSHYASPLHTLLLPPGFSQGRNVDSSASLANSAKQVLASDMQWQKPVTAQPFAPLLSLSPESSADSFGTHLPFAA